MVQIVEYLLDMSEVEVDSSETLRGDTALCAASAAGHGRCCEALIRRGASVSAANLKGSPPLQVGRSENRSLLLLLAL